MMPAIVNAADIAPEVSHQTGYDIELAVNDLVGNVIRNNVRDAICVAELDGSPRPKITLTATVSQPSALPLRSPCATRGGTST